MSALEFSGKRVLVTGSTRGIGRATAELIHARGGEVIWHGRQPSEALSAAADGRRQRLPSPAISPIAPSAGGSQRRSARSMCWSIAPASSREAPIAETSEALWDRDHRGQPDRRLDAVAGAAWRACAAGAA